MLDRVATAIGKGLFAGFAGTVATTVGQEVEMKIRGRPPSMIPAAIGSKVLRVEPRGAEGEAFFATIVHWTYGTTSGVARGLIALTGVQGPTAAAAHFALVWTGDMALLNLLGLAPPPWRWDAPELAIHTLHRLVLALATSAAYEMLRPA